MNKFYRMYRVLSNLKALIQTRHDRGPAGNFERDEFMDTINYDLDELSPDTRNQINDFIDKKMSCLVFKENFKFDDPAQIRYAHSIYNPMDAEKLLHDTYFEELCDLEYEIERFSKKLFEIEFNNYLSCCDTVLLDENESEDK